MDVVPSKYGSWFTPYQVPQLLPSLPICPSNHYYTTLHNKVSHHSHLYLGPPNTPSPHLQGVQSKTYQCTRCAERPYLVRLINASLVQFVLTFFFDPT
jgi:hypothetical protein